MVIGGRQSGFGDVSLYDFMILWSLVIVSFLITF